jgi:hypothetical protein
VLLVDSQILLVNGLVLRVDSGDVIFNRYVLVGSDFFISIQLVFKCGNITLELIDHGVLLFKGDDLSA